MSCINIVGYSIKPPEVVLVRVRMPELLITSASASIICPINTTYRVLKENNNLILTDCNNNMLYTL